MYYWIILLLVKSICCDNVIELNDINPKKVFSKISKTSSPIEHVEHLITKLGVLEDGVVLKVDALIKKMDKNAADTKLDFEDELSSLRISLRKLKKGLNNTYDGLQVVEENNDKQDAMLQNVLQKNKEQKQERALEKEGVKAIQYETGQLRNISGITIEQMEKLRKMEKKTDPAILHYDFELLGEITILFGVASVGGMLAAVMKLPTTIGYLVGGSIVGPSVGAWIVHYTEVETISLLGSIFLLFAHGAQYSIQQKDIVQNKYLLAGVVYVAAVVALIASVSLKLNWTSSVSEAIVFGVASSLSSTTTLNSYVRVKQLTHTSFGKATMAIVTIQDLIMSTILAMPEILVATSMRMFFIQVIKTAFSFGFIVTIATILHRYIVPKLFTALVQMEQVQHTSLVLLGVVSVCLSMAWMTEVLGLSLECGAFFAGLSFMGSKNLEITLTTIECLDHLFGSIFFACIGMIINPSFVLDNAMSILTMLGMVSFIKFSLAALIIKQFDASLKKVVNTAKHLTPVGEFALIFMIKAQALGLVTRHLYLLFLTSTAVFLGITPLLNQRVASHYTTFKLQKVIHKKHSADMP